MRADWMNAAAAPEDYELGFAGRATIDDLSRLGRQQMGLEAW